MSELNKNWKNKFNAAALEQGKKVYKNHRVVDLKKNGNAYSAAVLGKERFEVSLVLKNGLPVQMKCHCPLVRIGMNCEHLAAFLFAIEFAIEGKSEEKLSETEIEKGTEKETGKETEKETEKKTEKETEKEAGKKSEKKQQPPSAGKMKQMTAAAEQENREIQKENEEREERRAARDRRKAERAQKEAQRKQAAKAEQDKAYEKQQAEEARREAIRQQKKKEEQQRRQKRQKEQEQAKMAAEQRRLEEESRAKEEEQRKEEEAARVKAAEQRRAEEENRMKEEQERIARKRAEYTLLGDAWNDPDDFSKENSSLEKLEQYSYFDARSIARSVSLSTTAMAKGRKLYEQGLIDHIEVGIGFNPVYNSDEQTGQAVWEGQDGGTEIQTVLTFSRTKLLSTFCNCPQCQKQYSAYGWLYKEEISKCEYVAALLLALKDYLQNNNLGDATDRNAVNFLSLCRSRHVNLAAADKTGEEKSVTLKPRLVKKDGQLTVSFRIGTGKLLLIKQLGKFCDNVKNAATDVYGTSLKINHRRSNFTDESQKWLRFIERIVQEEEEFEQRMEDAMNKNYYYYRSRQSSNVGGSLDLFGWRLDEFFNTLGSGIVDYEDRDASATTKMQLTGGAGNPLVTIQIAEARLKERPSAWNFQGIQVTGRLPELFLGMDRAYYVDDSAARLCRSDQDFREKIEPLTSFINDSAEFSFIIGRNSMAEFYYHVLPTLSDIAEIQETNPDKIHSYLPPQVSFVFYMDARNSDVYCAPAARYGETEFSLLDYLETSDGTMPQSYRDFTGEQEMLQQLLNWLPEADLTTKELSCSGDEERIYNLMTKGVDELLTYGEVQCTKRFRSRQQVRRVKVSVGVSVSSDLLDLDISSEDLSMDELLDILNSYQEKKTYYRLKDGSYVDMDDQSLELLSEMMESMHLKPKDFVQGKMHLPLYRTLYLNKMLEENEHVYAERDSHFREIVKEFKTVNDADFEVPQSLAGIMRQYQKDGFKWLRELETWKFGGILADDMGLGKTLQIIALLLSARERREEKESMLTLVVVPASVVFNWGEEFERFAPQLRISLITGTQGERREKIALAGNFDVLVTSYDLLKRDIHLYEDLNFEYEIIDEAQYIKNHTTAAAKAVKVIKSRYRFALTGTPIENRLSELWSIFDFLMPGFLYSYEVFKRELETPIVKNQDKLAMQRLQKMTGPFILRRLKENVLKDLPEKLEEVRYVRFSGEQQRLYDGQVVHMRKKIASQNTEEFNKNKMVILAELTRLRQICCDPSLCFDDYHGASAKADACIDLVQSAIDGGHRVLLFSQFTSMLEILQQRLDEEGIPYFTIVGSTAKEKRLELVRDFNSGTTPVFLISLKAGGVGLNLTGADVVIHYDPWWNAAAQNQATDRAHRIGQKKKVTEYKLIMKNSIEEKILNLQMEKRDLADQVINGETGQFGSLSREDLLELLEA